MNAKKAKLLRRFVKQIAVDKNGNPMLPVRYFENPENRKTVDVEKVSGDGKGTYTDKEVISQGTIKVEPRTVRGVYLKMKKEFDSITTK